MGRGRGGSVAVQVGDGCGVVSDGLLRQIPRVGGDLAGGSPNTERERRLTRHGSRGGGVEGGGDDSQLPLHSLYHLTQIPPWIPGGSLYGDRHP